MPLNLRETALDAWAGLRATPARALLSFAALAAGLFSATLLLAVWSGLDRQARSLTSAFGADSFALLPDASDAASSPAWTRDHVDRLRRILRGRAWVSGARAVQAGGRTLLATDESWAAAHGWRILHGRPLDAADIRQSAPVLLTSDARARADNLSPTRPLLLDGVPLRWIGSTDAPADAPPCIPYTFTALESASPAPPDRTVDRIWFRARPGHSPEALRRLLAPRLAPAGLSNARWLTPETLLANIRRWQRMVAWGAGGGAFLGLLLGGTSLAGLLLAGVRERIAEIGLRRALGAGRADVAALFVSEALILTLAAALSGIAGAILLLSAVGPALPLPWHLTPHLCLLPAAAAIILAALASSLPAWTAAALPPAEALRNE
jgi:hypothetical protein